MRRALIGMAAVWFLVAACPLRAAEGGTMDIHVAGNGDDGGTGTAEKPFATLRKAVEASRGMKGDGARRIIVHGGKHYDVAVELGPEDSGLRIEAAGGERPVLYGGVRLGNWEKDGQRFYAAKLPGNRRWDVRLLQVNGRMCPRARLPETGTFTHESSFDVPWMSTTGGGWKRRPTTRELTTLKYREGDIGPWLEVKNAQITIYHMWDESAVGVVGNDVEQRILTLWPESGHPAGAFGVKKYVVWNIREGMRAEGQWYHDRMGGRIVYWPLSGEDMETAEAIVPTVGTMIRLRGRKEAMIRDVAVGGLTMSVTTTPLITGGFGAASFDGCVSLEYAEKCVLSGLTITQVAGHGMNSRQNCVGTRVERCEVSECGAGGIYVGGSKAVITNNHVRRVGMMYPSAMGIFGGGKGNVVSHNEVHDCPYSAINYGGEGNTVESNLIYDCMKVLHDGAAIYMFAAKNCIVRGNFARDIVDTGGYGASAYYLDERSEGSVVERNLSVNVRRPSHNHMASRNTIRNNVFVVKGEAKITFPRCADYTMEGNVVYATGKIRVEGIDAVRTWSRNVLYSATGKVEGVRLKDYSAAGMVDGAGEDTVVGDPMFVDWEKGDYRYKEGSAALKLGLEAIDVRGAGVERR